MFTKASKESLCLKQKKFVVCSPTNKLNGKNDSVHSYGRDATNVQKHQLNSERLPGVGEGFDFVSVSNSCVKNRLLQTRDNECIPNWVNPDLDFNCTVRFCSVYQSCREVWGRNFNLPISLLSDRIPENIFELV